MSKKIYTLLVGINQYADAANPQDTPSQLRGCVNDVRVFGEYLTAKAQREGSELCLKELVDRSATRAAVIDGFRAHLCRANHDDLVLFYYSGHGSRQQISPEVREFLRLDADANFLETLVCWDSRTEHSYDLADKELSVLIAEVSRNHPQIVVILDCCHSGGLVRANSVGRWSPNPTIERPLASFIFASEQLESLFPAANLDRAKANWLTGLASDYILLAACRSDQLAREHQYYERGAFSYFLTKSLSQTNSRASYRDIFHRINIAIATFYPNQSPQLTATNSDFLDRQFLGSNLASREHYFTVAHRINYGWVIDGGLLHGIQFNSETEKTRLAVFPLEVADLSQLALAIATVETIEVLPQLSRLNIAVESEPLDRELTYKAVVTSIPLSPLEVYLKGDEVAVNLARRAIRTASFGEQPSLYLREVVESAAEFYLVAEASQYTIIHGAKDRAEITTDSAISAIHSLEHIARWKNIVTLASPPHSRISTTGVQLQIYQADLEINQPQIRLEYQYIDGKWQPPTFTVKLTNHSERILYCTLLNLTQLYAVKSIPFAGNFVIRLEPGESIWALDRNPIHACIPNDILQLGTVEYQDILKLICNTSNFDAHLLEQASIAERINSSRSSLPTIERSHSRSSLERLMNKIQNRAIQASINTETIGDDWVTSEVLITTVITLDSIEHRGGYSDISTIKMPERARQLNSQQPELQHPRFNYLVIVSAGVILGLVVLFSYLIWQQSHQQQRNKDPTSNRVTLTS